MTSFDLSYLQNLLLAINSTNKSIKSISFYVQQYFDKNKESILSLFLNIISLTTEESKLYSLWLLFHELIFAAALEYKLDNIFSLASILPSLIHNIILNINDINRLFKIIQILHIWNKYMIFSNVYLNEIKEKIETRINEVSDYYNIQYD